MTNGHDECVQIYVKEIIASNLSNDIKQTLLVGRSDNDYPALYSAMQHNHATCVKTYLELLLKMDLPEGDKRMMLAFILEGKILWQYQKKFKLKPAAVKAYKELIQAAGFDA